MLQDSIEVLQKLKTIKSELEGTEIRYEKTKVNQDVFTNLRRLLLTYIPQSITSEIWQKFNAEINNLFQSK